MGLGESIERILLVALGGAAGSVLRYLAAVHFGSKPSTIFGVNITGSFLIGLLISSAAGSDPRLRLLVGVGLLGGFTTFSTWQLDALLSLRQQDWAGAGVNLLGSVICGFIAVALGYAAGLRLR